MHSIFGCQAISLTKRVRLCPACQVSKPTALSGQSLWLTEMAKMSLTCPKASVFFPRHYGCLPGSAFLVHDWDHDMSLYLLHYLLDWHVLTLR